ncbi:MAG TPA: AcvB/VirJ family lysyl-phosphatidylglycerol hydrolase [Acidobacteriota bacterium]|nr:AcvB/VirJ family lysyl-phosphatidylglycerol hydrolase [Acidobacteriota bacterium]
MRKALLTAILSAILCSPLMATEGTLGFGRFGTVHLYHQTATPPRVSIFLSGDGGWKLGVIDMSRELEGHNALIIGVDIVHYLKELDLTSDECSYAVTDFEEMTKFVEKSLGYSTYVKPSLIGYSSGATLVYGLMAQAPPDTFVGGISLGFCPDLWNRKIFCKGAGLESKKNPKEAGYLFQVADNLRNPWIALQGTVDKICSPPDTESFVNRVPGGEIVMLPKVGHGFSVPRNWMPQLKQSFERIYSHHQEQETAASQSRQ